MKQPTARELEQHNAVLEQIQKYKHVLLPEDVRKLKQFSLIALEKGLYRKRHNRYNDLKPARRYSMQIIEDRI